MFKNCRKEDLLAYLIVALELGETVAEKVTIVKLTEIIEENKYFKEDVEFVKELIQYTIEDRKRAEEDRKRVEEDRKKEAEDRLREKELELEIARLNVRVNSDNERTGEACNSLDALVKSVRILTVKVPNRPEGWAFLFASLERAFVSKNVPEKFKSEILLNLLGEKASNVLTYVKEGELNNYEQLKSIILREYEPSANQFLEQFKKATRHPNETYIQYTSRLITNWQYYLKLRKVSDFDNLNDLIVSDKIFSSLEKEVASHISVRAENDCFHPLELAKEMIDLYNTSREVASHISVRRKMIAFKSLKPLPNVLTRNNPVKNASREFLKRVQMLLGAEVFYELMLPGQFKMEGSNVIFQNTVFRCIVSGSTSSDAKGKEHCGFIQAADNLEHSIKKFWEIENVEIDSVKTSELDICEDHFKNTHSRDDQGRYTVAMPLKEDPSCLGESKQTVIQRLNSLWKRLSRDKEYLCMYEKFLQEYEDFFRPHEGNQGGGVWNCIYMPHHGVYRPEKSTTKLRTVFNASNPSTSGKSLNSIQFNGPRRPLFHYGSLTKAQVCLYYGYRENVSHDKPRANVFAKNSVEEGPRGANKNVRVHYGTVGAPSLATMDEANNFPLAAPVAATWMTYYRDPGLLPEELRDDSLWWHGPELLQSAYSTTVIAEPTQRDDFDCELRVSERTLETSLLSSKNFDFFNHLMDLSNNYFKIIHIVSYIYRFIENCRSKVKKRGPLTTSEVNDAETWLIKQDQSGINLSDPSGNLKSLNIFQDDKGILRVGGRLEKASIPYSQKHPAILAKNSKLSKIYFITLHKKLFHVGPQGLLNAVRLRFWAL
ncbi:integrase catalytic domain-containing protein [Trichonephila clavipes]|nr:integrase catalytic domain-containing protein [Trichonephila clavipes]